MWRGPHWLLLREFLPVCQFKDRNWMSQVHQPAVFNSRGPPRCATSMARGYRMQNNCISALQCHGFHPLLTALGSCSHLLSPSFEIILFLLQYKDPLIYNVVLAYAILTLLLNEVCVPGSKLVASYTDLCSKHFRSQRKKTEHAVTEDIKRLCCYS